MYANDRKGQFIRWIEHFTFIILFNHSLSKVGYVMPMKKSRLLVNFDYKLKYLF